MYEQFTVLYRGMCADIYVSSGGTLNRESEILPCTTLAYPYLPDIKALTFLLFTNRRTLIRCLYVSYIPELKLPLAIPSPRQVL